MCFVTELLCDVTKCKIVLTCLESPDFGPFQIQTKFSSNWKPVFRTHCIQSVLKICARIGARKFYPSDVTVKLCSSLPTAIGSLCLTDLEPSHSATKLPNQNCITLPCQEISVNWENWLSRNYQEICPKSKAPNPDHQKFTVSILLQISGSSTRNWSTKRRIRSA